MSNSPLQDILNLTPKADKKIGAEFSHKKAKEADHNIGESFLTSLLQAINETNEFLPQHLKISEKELIMEAVDKLQIGSFDESDKMSIFENASFMQILSMLDKLQVDKTDIKFNNLSNQLKQDIVSEKNFNSLKNAKDLNELLKIAKDLNLNIKDVKVDRLLDLKATFANLDKKDFFKGSIDDVFKKIINQKIESITKNLDKNEISNHLPNKNQQAKKTKESDLFLKTLQNIEELTKDKKVKTKDVKKDDVDDDKLSLKTNNQFEIKDSEKSKISLDKNNQDPKIKDLVEEKNIKTNENTNIKEIEKIQTKQVQKNEKINNTKAEKVQTNEFIAPLKEKEKENKETKINLENSLQSIKTNAQDLKSTQTINNKEFNNNFLDLKQESAKEIKTENKEISTTSKDENFDLNNLVRELSKTNQNQIKNQVNVKETFDHFAQDLKESLKEYKAPITKISLTLNPSNLGEVEVTLVQRGNNLHINFNSNTNAMNLFIQNQAEFKNSLVNMGFTGLEMNFSDQGKKDQREQQGKNRSGYGFDEEIEGLENNQSLEIVLAKYF